jgi:hypothetical protein
MTTEFCAVCGDDTDGRDLCERCRKERDREQRHKAEYPDYRRDSLRDEVEQDFINDSMGRPHLEDSDG